MLISRSPVLVGNELNIVVKENHVKKKNVEHTLTLSETDLGQLFANMALQGHAGPYLDLLVS